MRRRISLTVAAFGVVVLFLLVKHDPIGWLTGRATTTQSGPVIAALIAFVMNLVIETLKAGFGYTTRRDEAAVKEQVERNLSTMRIEIEESVRAKVARDLKSHEARLRVATDAYVKLLDRQFESVGQVRQRINKVASSIREYTVEACLQGESEHAHALMKACDSTMASVGEVMGYLPGELSSTIEGFLGDCEDALKLVAKWASESDQRREEGAREIDSKQAATLEKVRSAIVGWQATAIKQYQTELEKIAEIEALAPPSTSSLKKTT